MTTPKEEELREKFVKDYWSDDLPDEEDLVNRPERIANYWLKIRREAIAERDEEIKKIINNWKPIQWDVQSLQEMKVDILSLIKN